MSRAVQLIEKNYGTHRGYVRTLLGQAEYLLGSIAPFLSLQPENVRRLAFVCLGNINRSAFAESAARLRGANTCSFGLSASTGRPAYAKALELAPRFRADLSCHQTTDIADYQHETGDLLIAMEIRHARRLVACGYPAESIILLGNWATPHRIHIHDPYSLSDEYFMSCFTIINSAVQNLIDTLKRLPSPCLLNEHKPDALHCLRD